MEIELNTKFEKAREQGRKISYKWILCYAKEIYCGGEKWARQNKNQVTRNNGCSLPKADIFGALALVGRH